VNYLEGVEISLFRLQFIAFLFLFIWFFFVEFYHYKKRLVNQHVSKIKQINKMILFLLNILKRLDQNCSVFLLYLWKSFKYISYSLSSANTSTGYKNSRFKNILLCSYKISQTTSEKKGCCNKKHTQTATLYF